MKSGNERVEKTNTIQFHQGLRKPATKTATARVLSTFLDIAAKKAIGNNMLGYLAALLPIKGDDVDNMRQLYVTLQTILSG